MKVIPGIPIFIKYTHSQKIGKSGITSIKYAHSQKIGKPGIASIKYTLKVRRLESLE
jgi:hypothetical protein